MQFSGERRIDLQQLVGIGRAEIELVEGEQLAQPRDRIVMIIDAQVEVTVIVATVTAVRLDDDHCGGLFAAPVTANRVTGL